MNSSPTRLRRPRRVVDRRVRVLAATWWVAVGAMAVPFLMLMVASDHLEDRYPGAVLGVMLAGAAFVAGKLPGWSTRGGRQLSLMVSALWLAGAGLVYPTQDFAADAAWAAGVPVLVAVVTVVLALRLRATRPSSTSA